MPTRGCLPPSPHKLRPQASRSRPVLGPRHPVPLALTFKVPLLLPPTFTLILLPKENLQERRRERDVREAHKGHLLPENNLSPLPPHTPPKLTPPRALSHFSPLKTLLGRLCIC